MKRGYVKIWRKLEDSPINSYGLKPVGLFLHILLKANHEKKDWRDEILFPGSLITSINNLSLLCYESPKSLRRLLKILSENNMIKIEIRANQWHKITVCNWETYQMYATVEGKPREQLMDKPREQERDKLRETSGTTSGNASDPQLKNVKNEKNYKNDNNNIPDWLDSNLWDDFLEMRKKIKKPMTDRAKELMFMKLEKLGIDKHKEILEQSIVNCWQDVFKLREDNKSNKPINVISRMPTDEEYKACENPNREEGDW